MDCILPACSTASRITQSLETLVQNIPLAEPEMSIAIRTESVVVMTICPGENRNNVPYSLHVTSQSDTGNGSTLETASFALARGSVPHSDG